MTNIKKSFGVQLKKYRLEKNITQEKLAELIDINQRQLTRIETGKSFPSAATLEKICGALDVVPAELFNFTCKQLGVPAENADSALLNTINAISDSPHKLKFIKLVLLAVNNDKSALLKLQSMIEGMLLLYEK